MFCSTQVSSDPGKLHSEGLVHLLRYIRDNKTLSLKYYANMKHEPLFDLLRQASNKLRVNFWIYLIIFFYQGGPIDHGTHVPGPVYQSSVEI